MESRSSYSKDYFNMPNWLHSSNNMPMNWETFYENEPHPEMDNTNPDQLLSSYGLNNYGNYEEFNNSNATSSEFHNLLVDTDGQYSKWMDIETNSITSFPESFSPTYKSSPEWIVYEYGLTSYGEADVQIATYPDWHQINNNYEYPTTPAYYLNSCGNSMATSESSTPSFTPTNVSSSYVFNWSDVNVNLETTPESEQNLHEQIRRNEEICHQLSPIRKYHEKMQLQQKKANQQNIRRKFSLMSGTGNPKKIENKNLGLKKPLKLQKSTSISVRRWQSEIWTKVHLQKHLHANAGWSTPNPKLATKEFK